MAASIRKAASVDAEAIFSVHQASVRTLCAAAYSREHIESWFEDRTSEIYAPALAAGYIWVVEQDGQIVGFVGAEPGEVTLLFVHPQVSGQGIGRQLFEFGASLAAASSEQPLTVVATKNSESFYATFGFVRVEKQAFVRGAQGLRYEVVKMQRHTVAHAHNAHVAADA